ncbi:hypothetical protein [Nitratifractor sp.]
MKKITARDYAREHRLSLFEVIRKTNRGELRSEIIEERGRKITYILLEEEVKSSAKNQEAQKSDTKKRGKGFDETGLYKRLESMEEEIRALRKIIEKCCEEKEKK